MLSRKLPLVAGDIAVASGWQHRSITDGQSSTSTWRGRPTDSAKAPRRLAANRKALARFGLSGFAWAVTFLANEAAASDTARGVNRSITSWSAGGSGFGRLRRFIVLYIYSTIRGVVVDGLCEDELWR